MKNIFILILLCCLSFLSMAQDIEDNAIADQYIIHLHSGVKADAFFQSYPQSKIIQCLSERMNIWLIHSDSPKLLSTLKENTAVIAAQYNHNNVRRRSLVPNDSYFGNQWNMQNLAHPGADISATDAWQVNHRAVTQTGDTIVVAIIDGTFDIYHDDLNFFVNKNEIPNNGIDDDGNGYIDDYHGWNVFMNNDSVYDTFDNHGTHVSGIAGAITNNNQGVAGVCWGVKVLAIDGSSTLESDVIKAYDYVIAMRSLYDQTSGAKGAFIVATNSSFGVDRGQPASYPIWCSMYDSMGYYGILSACATANGSWDVDQVGDIPTACPSKWMIAVTNTTPTDTRNSGAAYGAATIDIGAPGTGIESTFPGSSYGTLSGTSMSTPHITGAVAAMIANACPRLIQDYFAYPDSIALVLRDYMYAGADPLSSLAHITTSGGRLNLYHAYLAESAYNCNNCHYNLHLSQINPTCYGDTSGTITAAADSGSGGYNYLWSDSSTTPHITHLKAGFYQLTVTDSTGCQRYATAQLTQPSALSFHSLTVVPFTDSSNGNAVLVINAGNDTLSYAVDTGSFQSGHILVIDTPGIHHFRVRNSNGCEIDTTWGIFYTGIQERSALSYISLSPNPAESSTQLMVRADKNYMAHLALSDLTGRLVYQEPMMIAATLQVKTIDLSMLSDGVYILSVIHDGQALAAMKVSVIH